mgnify:FL=1|jgi:hypothetical protein|tara:strand:+ start:1640 stop:2299 length:660 start_codon:yes stop_codon:yes gene_type:complete
MNFIAATIELRSFISDPINAYGLDYRGADAVVPSGSGASEVKLRVLCYDREGPKLSLFKEWKPNTRALITGNLVFSDDTSKPLDLIVTTIEPGIPDSVYCNQVVLGNAFFGADEIKERKNNQVAVKIGTSLDNSDIVTWLFLETHESRKKKLTDRIRKGRPICVQGYLREYRKDDSDSPYRAIVASDFTTRKDREKSSRNPQTNGSAAGYTEVDPTPDY